MFPSLPFTISTFKSLSSFAFFPAFVVNFVNSPADWSALTPASSSAACIRDTSSTVPPVACARSFAPFAASA